MCLHQQLDLLSTYCSLEKTYSVPDFTCMPTTNKFHIWWTPYCQLQKTHPVSDLLNCTFKSMGFLLWDVAPCHCYANKSIPTPHPTMTSMYFSITFLLCNLGYQHMCYKHRWSSIYSNHAKKMCTIDMSLSVTPVAVLLLWCSSSVLAHPDAIAYRVMYVNSCNGTFNKSYWNGGEEMPCTSLELVLEGAEYLNSTTVNAEQSQCVDNTTTNVYTSISESEATSNITDCPPWMYPNGSIRERGDSLDRRVICDPELQHVLLHHHHCMTYGRFTQKLRCWSMPILWLHSTEWDNLSTPWWATNQCFWSWRGCLWIL